MSEKKATLIKHVKSANVEAEPTTPVEAAPTKKQPKIEKKKIVVTKKVARVKPQTKKKKEGE